MRPGQSSPGKLNFKLKRSRPESCFNEAGAIKPRKTVIPTWDTEIIADASMRPGQSSPGKPLRECVHTDAAAPGFNEAGAIKPRKTMDEAIGMLADLGFNEAGAIKPRKTVFAAHIDPGQSKLQ